MSETTKTERKSNNASNACTGADPPLALLAVRRSGSHAVAQLMVRNLPEDLVKALKQRAAKNNRSAEQEHREILQAALRGPRRRSLIEVLRAMPNVGKDEDFARHQVSRRE